MTYDRKGILWQPKPSTQYPGVAKSWKVETAFDDIAGVWHPATVVGLASRNARCSEFTDISQFAGVPGKDGDCLLVTYRMVNEDQYVRAAAVNDKGEVGPWSNTLYLPEPVLGLGFWVLALFLMLAVATDGPRRSR